MFYNIYLFHILKSSKLSDIDHDFRMDLSEFCIGMRLTYLYLNGVIKEIPKEVPQVLLQSPALQSPQIPSTYQNPSQKQSTQPIKSKSQSHNSSPTSPNLPVVTSPTSKSVNQGSHFIFLFLFLFYLFFKLSIF